MPFVESETVGKSKRGLTWLIGFTTIKHTGQEILVIGEIQDTNSQNIKTPCNIELKSKQKKTFYIFIDHGG